MKKILFFEPEIVGHQLDYIEHLCNYYRNNFLPFELLFIVNNIFFQTIRERKKENLFQLYKETGIRFIEISEKEVKQCTSSNLLKAAMFKWYVAKKYAQKNEVDHMHFMFYDHLQLPLALKLNMSCNFTISGLLFRLSLNNKDNSDTIIFKFGRFLKKIFYQGMLNNRHIKTVFSLDPYFEEYAKNNFKNGTKVKALPDPSLFEQKYKMYKDSLIDFSESGRKLFIMFGYIQERKGIFQLLHSFKYLDKSIVSKLAIHIAGQIDKNIRNDIRQIENEIRKTHDNIKLNIWDRYVSDQELVSLITSSDCVLAPYQYFTGSSGVIFWAAGANKPIITQNYGLLGRWTRENKLGITTNTERSSKLSEAIIKFFKSKNEQLYDTKKMREFANNNTPERFAEKTFNSLLFKGAVK